MPFGRILRELVASVDSARAAVFIDHQGEAVETVGDLPPYDMKVIGAYQGIFFSQAAALSDSLEHGVPQRIKIQWERSLLLSEAVDEEYFVVIVLGRNANEGLAWRALSMARDRIREEMA